MLIFLLYAYSNENCKNISREEIFMYTHVHTGGNVLQIQQYSNFFLWFFYIFFCSGNQLLLMAHKRTTRWLETLLCRGHCTCHALLLYSSSAAFCSLVAPISTAQLYLRSALTAAVGELMQRMILSLWFLKAENTF